MLAQLSAQSVRGGHEEMRLPLSSIPAIPTTKGSHPVTLLPECVHIERVDTFTGQPIGKPYGSRLADRCEYSLQIQVNVETANTAPRLSDIAIGGRSPTFSMGFQAPR